MIYHLRVWKYSILLYILFLLIVNVVDLAVEKTFEEGETSSVTNKVKEKKKVAFALTEEEEMSKLAVSIEKYKEFLELSDEFHKQNSLINDFSQCKRLNPDIIKYINSAEKFEIFDKILNGKMIKNKEKNEWFVVYKFESLLNKHIKSLKENKFFEILNKFLEKREDIRKIFGKDEKIVKYFENQYKQLEENLEKFGILKKDHKNKMSTKKIGGESEKEIVGENEMILEEINEIFIKLENKGEEEKQIESLPEFGKIFKPIFDSMFLSKIGKEEAKEDLKNKFEEIYKEYPDIEFFFKTYKRFNRLLQSFNFLIEKERNHKKLKGVEVKYKEVYEKLNFLKENKFSTILKEKEICEKKMKNSKRENEFVQFICNEIDIFFKNVGKVHEEFTDNEDNIKIEIKDFFKELKKKWKEENPTMIKKFAKKVKKWVKENKAKQEEAKKLKKLKKEKEYEEFYGKK